MSTANFKPPRNRKDKIKLLKELQSGAKTLSELLNKEWEVTMWKDCDTDNNFLVSFDGLHKISKVDFETKRQIEKSMFVTLEIQ